MLRTSCPCRAAVRYRKRYDGAHRCDPPFITRRVCSLSTGGRGAQQPPAATTAVVGGGRHVVTPAA